MSKLEEAQDFVDKNKKNVNTRFKPAFHASSPFGWVNDPNGMIWFKDKGHLFFQYYPYESKWGPMHWGHVTTTDFVKWDVEKIALAPSEEYDKEFGCFSGTSIEHDNKIYAFYTGVANGLQQQCLAISSDGVNFVKSESNPLIKSSDLPTHIEKENIRDPKVFEINGEYYCLLGTKTNGFGNVVLFKSLDLINYQYVGDLLNNNKPNEKNFYELSGVYECPDFINIDEKQILLISPQFLSKEGNKYQNIHSAVYMVGNLDLNNGKFDYNSVIDIDSGFDFYAPQTMKLPDGRTIMIAWLQMWDRDYVTASDNWVGCFTIPRELSIKNNKLYQLPIKELNNYRCDEVSYNDIQCNDTLVLNDICGNNIDLEVEFDIANCNLGGLKVLKSNAYETIISFDKEKQVLSFDRSNSGLNIGGKEDDLAVRSVDLELKDKLSLRILIDVSCVEIFINNGQNVLSSNVYNTNEVNDIEFFGKNLIIKTITKYNIKI